MRSREEIEQEDELDGDWDGADYSKERMRQRLILEVLLDIRDCLQAIDNNVNRMDDRQRGL